MKDWWVDGHFISADSPEEASDEVARIFAPYQPELVRPWTTEDQIELERISP